MSRPAVGGRLGGTGRGREGFEMDVLVMEREAGWVGRKKMRRVRRWGVEWGNRRRGVGMVSRKFC